MTRRLLITASIIALSAGSFASAGCSSSSSNNGTGTDSGTTENDSSAPIDTGVASDDGGTTDTGTTTSGDTGTTTTGDGSMTTGDAGTCTALASVSNIPAYTNVVHTSACSAAQEAAFLTACGSSGNTTSCNTWFTSNAACGQCISPAPDSGAGENSGALLVDSAGDAFLNVAGCVQIVDGNTTCSNPLEELTLCELDACDSAACEAADQTDFQNCQTAADSLACASQVTAAFGTQAAPAVCSLGDSADGGAFSVCDPSTAAGTTTIIDKICGNGM